MANIILCYRKISLSLPLCLIMVYLSNYLYLSLYLSTDYLTNTSFYPKWTVSNIPKKGISKLGASLLDNTDALCGLITKEPAAQAFYSKIYLSIHKRMIWPLYTCGYSASNWLRFLCLASVPLKPRARLWVLLDFRRTACRRGWYEKWGCRG